MYRQLINKPYSFKGFSFAYMACGDYSIDKINRLSCSQIVNKLEGKWVFAASDALYVIVDLSLSSASHKMKIDMIKKDMALFNRVISLKDFTLAS